MGEFPAFFEWSIKRGVAYASHGRAGSALARAAGSTALCVGATCAPWVLAVRETFRPRPDVVWRGLVLLLWMSFIPVALGGRFYEHYYLQFVPPLAVLAAPGAAELAAHWRELLPRGRAGGPEPRAGARVGGRGPARARRGAGAALRRCAGVARGSRGGAGAAAAPPQGGGGPRGGGRAPAGGRQAANARQQLSPVRCK